MAENTNSSGRKETLVWTNDEAELLLQVTLDYKTKKLQENVDWESCKSKYGDIMDAFVEQYPRQPAADRKKFPHRVSDITKPQLTAKLKAIRSKYRAAVETGERYGHGRVIYEYFELCSKIWAGSSPSRSSSPTLEAAPVSPIEFKASPCPQDESSESQLTTSSMAVRHRRDLLQAKLTIHKTDRLKRKLPADHFMHEDLKIKKRMLALMEDSSRRSAETIASITSTIQDSVSLMRQLIVPSPTAHAHSSSSGYGQFQSMPGPYPATPHGHSAAFMPGGPHPSTSHTHTEIKKELDTSQQHIQQRIQEREKDVKVLHQEVESINQFADKAVEDSDTIFNELVSSVLRKRSEVKERIRVQQKHEVSRVEELRKRVEQEVSELKTRHAELEQISHTEEHSLHSYTSLSKISESTHPVISSVCHFEDVTVAVSKMRDKLEDILKEEGTTNVSETVNTVDVLLLTPLEPKTES